LFRRGDYDIDPKWDAVDYDYLGDFRSSHVKPVFWKRRQRSDQIARHKKPLQSGHHRKRRQVAYLITTEQ